VELTREIARRFNYIYGREPDFEARAEAAIKKMGKKAAKLYRTLRKGWTEQGDEEALTRARALLEGQQNITLGDRERLFGFLEGGGRIILPEPEALLTEAAKMPGLDGQKMSKSYGNTIAMRDDPARVEKVIKGMPTDPARVRRTDPGDPAKCPVWELHLVYASEQTRQWVVEGCQSAGIGCLDCKGPLIDELLKEQRELHDRAQPYLEDPTLVRNIIADGCERAGEAAEETMEEVRRAVGTDYY
jgi:tryptophanyl-tRNA synthetase